MILALRDYIHFRNQTGRYSRAAGFNVMCAAYEDRLPAEVLLALQSGDMIFVGNFNWWISWLIMYLTDSQISHAAVYVGDGKIRHATLNGVELAPVESLFRRKNRLLACKVPLSAEQREKLHWKSGPVLDDRNYSVLGVMWKGLVILTGRDVPGFRWRFFTDVASWFIAMDLIALVLFGRFIGFVLVPLAHLIAILINRFRWPPAPSSWFTRNFGKPSDLLEGAVLNGAGFLPDPMSPWARRAIADPSSPFTATIFRRKSDLQQSGPSGPLN